MRRKKRLKVFYRRPLNLLNTASKGINNADRSTTDGGGDCSNSDRHHYRQHSLGGNQVKSNIIRFPVERTRPAPESEDDYLMRAIMRQAYEVVEHKPRISWEYEGIEVTEYED